MIASLAANIVFLVHLAFILFAALGGLLVLFRPKIAYLHIPCAVWAILIEFGGWICPLTHLEVFLWQQAGRSGYTGGFIEHYLVPLVYPAELTRGMQITFGILVLAVNLVVYARLWRKRKRHGAAPSGR